MKYMRNTVPVVWTGVPVTMTGIAGHDPGISGHVRPESLVTLLRNTHMLQPTTARECKSNTLYTLLCVVACERVQSEFKSHKRKDSLRLMSYKF